MNAHGTVAVSMLWVGALVFFSRGWITKMRDFIQHLSGV